MPDLHHCQACKSRSPQVTPACCARADDREFTFTSALQTHFAVKPLGDYPLNSQFVKLLGLGGKMGLDYVRDPSHPSLVQQEGDYVQFGGEWSCGIATSGRPAMQWGLWGLCNGSCACHPPGSGSSRQSREGSIWRVKWQRP